VLVLVCTAGVAHPSSEPDPTSTPVASGDVVELAFSPGERHRYRFAPDGPAAEGSWRIAVEQLGINLLLEVTPDGQDGAAGTLVDSPTNRYGTESVVVAGSAGPWRIEVRTAAGETASESYRLEVVPLPDDTPAGRLRLQAEKAFTEAGRLYAADPTASRQAVLEQSRRALELGRELGDPRIEGRAQHAVGALLRKLDEPTAAAGALAAAAELWRQTGEADLEIMALNELGLARWQAGDLAGAQGHFQRGLEVSLVHGRRPLEVVSRSNLCLVLHYQGDLAAAQPCYEDALRLAEQLDRADVQATLLTNLGGVHYQLGEPSPARHYYERALDMQRRLADVRGQAALLNNLAALHVSTGEYQQALLDYERALDAYRQFDDRRGEARTLNNLGHTFQLVGEPQRARTFYEQALPLRRDTEDRRGEAVTLNNLGNLLRLGGDSEEALTYHRAALDLHRALESPLDVGITRQLTGQALLDLGRSTEALAELDAAVAAFTEVGERRRLAAAQRHRADARPASERGSARHDLETAMDLYRGAGDRLGEALSELSLSRLDRGDGLLAAAVERTERAIATLEAIRAGVDTPDLRASFLASQRQAYELLIDLQVRRGQVEKGLETAEAASARTLLDAVHEAAAELPRAIDSALAEQRDETERRLRVKTDRRLDLDPVRESEKVAQLDSEIDALLADLDALEARIRRADPRYAQLTKPPLLSFTGMRSLLGEDTVLLRYALGAETSYLWRVSSDEVTVHPLPPRREVEALARAAHEALRQPSPSAAGVEAAVTALAERILAPAAAGLDRRRVLVVADGALHYVPFAALPIPGAGGELLLDVHEVVTAPSMSVLDLQRQALERRRPSPHTLAIVADPVFDVADHRVGSRQARSTGADAVAAAEPRGPVQRGQDFVRLRFSRREADLLASLVPLDEQFVALDFAASREMVLSGALAPYRVVHFATHGILDSQRPELSALVLSRVDAEGRPQSGLLGLRDIYDLDLGAELVVLSGCRTALGREVQGEGLVGLTRGFLYAGVPRVVASLWPVDDRATSELMAAFYRGLLEDGLPPGEALTRARREVRSQPRTRHPYYWAPFILQGEWRAAGGGG
jgi:CHAT domain-containing protein/Tfp pilus assembly protein PilF